MCIARPALYADYVLVGCALFALLICMIAQSCCHGGKRSYSCERYNILHVTLVWACLLILPRLTVLVANIFEFIVDYCVLVWHAHCCLAMCIVCVELDMLSL